METNLTTFLQFSLLTFSKSKNYILSINSKKIVACLLLIILSCLSIEQLTAQCDFDVDGGTYDPLCINDEPIPLMGTPPGGIWSGDGVVDNGDGTYSFDPAIIINLFDFNNTNVRYTYSDSTCIRSDFGNIDVIGYDFLLPDTICDGDAPIQLIPFSAGRGILVNIPGVASTEVFNGEFSGSGITFDSTLNYYQFDPSGLNGPVTISVVDTTDTTLNCITTKEITVVESPELDPITVEFCEGDLVDLTTYQDDLITTEGNFSFITGFQNSIYISNPIIPGISILDLNDYGIDSIQSDVGGGFLNYTFIDISPDGTLIYIENGTQDVLVIDATTNTVVDTIFTSSTLSNNSGGLILSPDGQTLYVVTDRSLQIVDLSTNMVTDSILINQIGNNSALNGLTISPDGQTLYLGSNFNFNNSNNLYIIDLTNNTVDSLAIGQTGSFSQIFDIEVSPNGQTVYISSTSDSTVYVLDPSTNMLIDSIQFPIRVYDIEISPDGQTVFVTGFSSELGTEGVVYQIDAASNTITNSQPAILGGTLNISPDGQTLYLASYFLGLITILDPTDLSIERFLFLPSVFSVTFGDFLNQGVPIEDPSMYTAQDGDSIKVCFTSTIGCQTCTTVNFVENSAPPTDAEDYGPLCSSDAPIALGGLPVGGTWSGPGVTGNTFDPSVGTSTLIYTYDVGNCFNIDSTTIVVNDTPTPDAGVYDAICEAEGLLLLEGTPAGGTWSGTGVIDNGDGTYSFDPTGLLGINTLTYTASDANGCTASATVDIEVNEGEPIVDCTWNDISGFIYMGEFNGSHYYCSSSSNYTWHQANNAAQNAGGYLVVINDYDENEYVRSQIMANNIWIGYNDQASETNFVWSNGDPSTYNYWESGQPNNLNGNEHYTRLRKSSGKWTDRPNNYYYEFVMEVPCVEAFSCEPVSDCETPDNDELCYSSELVVDGDCATDCTEEATTSTWPGNYGINCGNTYPYNDLWYTTCIPASGSLDVEVSEGSMSDPLIAVYYYFCGNLYILASTPNGAINVTGPPGYALYYRIWGDNDNTGTFTICATDGQQSNKRDNTTFDITQSIDEELSINLNILNVNIAPNPVIDKTVISYQLEMEDDVLLNIYDVTGKIVYQTSPELKEPGFHQQELQINLTKGLYFIEVKGSNWQVVKEMVVIK